MNKQFDYLTDKILANRARINKYLCDFGSAKHFDNEKVVEVIKQNYGEHFTYDDIKMFGYNLSQAIVRKDHYAIKKILGLKRIVPFAVKQAA